MMDQNKPNTFSHKQMAAQCFNATWDFLDKNERTREESEEMIHLAHTSFWHWTQAPEHTSLNLSIGYWQLSRVYAVAGLGERSLYYGKQCLQISETTNLQPFYIAYGFEAISRANFTLGDFGLAKENLNSAIDIADGIENEEYKAMITKDLKEIEQKLL